MNSTGQWPILDYSSYEPTRATLHMYTQIIGKLRLAFAPPQAQWAHAPLKLSANGLSTGPLWVGDGTVGIDMDLINHEVRFVRSDGQRIAVPLEPRAVAGFYSRVFDAMSELDIPVNINPIPQEVPDPISFDGDTVHRSYDPEQANRLWQALIRAGSVFEEFQRGFWGKQSPVSFYWGGFDLGVNRYSGRAVEPPPGLPKIMSGSMDAELMSVGFNFGNPQMPAPSFTAIAYPLPEGAGAEPLSPPQANFVEMPGMGGVFVLSYEDAVASGNPREAVLEFARGAYATIADLGGWDRALLERRSPDLLVREA